MYDIRGHQLLFKDILIVIRCQPLHMSAIVEPDENYVGPSLICGV